MVGIGFTADTPLQLQEELLDKRFDAVHVQISEVTSETPYMGTPCNYLRGHCFARPLSMHNVPACMCERSVLILLDREAFHLISSSKLEEGKVGKRDGPFPMPNMKKRHTTSQHNARHPETPLRHQTRSPTPACQCGPPHDTWPHQKSPTACHCRCTASLQTACTQHQQHMRGKWVACSNPFVLHLSMCRGVRRRRQVHLKVDALLSTPK
jgi:hypothetical protein